LGEIEMKTNQVRVTKSLWVSALILVLSASLAPAGISAIGQEQNADPRPATPSSAGQPEMLDQDGQDYKIRPGDVLNIQIEKAPELSGTKKVTSKGTIKLPYIGDVEVATLTAEQLEKQLTDRLRGEYLVNPQVSVSVTGFMSWNFYIQGSVRNPGVYQMAGSTKIMKLITQAGGLDKDHGSTAFIFRESKQKSVPQPGGSADENQQEPEIEMLKVNIEGLFKGDFEQNIVIEPGDLIHIPPTGVFFVSGAVRKPGSFPLKEGTTLRQAISLAEGMNFEAAKDRGIIFRAQSKTGKPEEIKVDINAVMNGKREDIVLLPGDVIIIPDSKLKSIGGTLLKTFGLGMVGPGLVLR
jgi:polysaccharide export outer membrane protein